MAWKTRLAGIQRLVNLMCPAIMFLDCRRKTPNCKNVGMGKVGPDEHQLAENENPATGMESPLYHDSKVGTENKKCNPFC